MNATALFIGRLGVANLLLSFVCALALMVASFFSLVSQDLFEALFNYLLCSVLIGAALGIGGMCLVTEGSTK